MLWWLVVDARAAFYRERVRFELSLLGGQLAVAHLLLCFLPIDIATRQSYSRMLPPNLYHVSFIEEQECRMCLGIHFFSQSLLIRGNGGTPPPHPLGITDIIVW